ncbi:MAG: dynamin family protein [Desulfuromonadales bacterium]|nr:dynamin family protein [Desulfuromonadales bacterium]MBN2791417.1 dynamin family protein [Desulfuromonadales bacterium]
MYESNREAQPGVSELKDSLLSVAASLDVLDGEYAEYKKQLHHLHERLVEGQFRLAVLGQFKRGKSTLLNALLGEYLLPTDILPVTAIPTFIRYSPEISACVYFSSDRPPEVFTLTEYSSLADFLVEFVTEAGNPHNQHQVERVEIGHPAKLLQQGVILIDTPGIGSTHRHNTEVAYQILPQCDAALFLVSPDPPITEVELDYLKEICQQLPRTFYLLNKIDFLSEPEQIASLKFLADQLASLLQGPPQILPVSARKGLEARVAGDQQGWKESGMQQVDQNLIDFFAREKQQTLESSIRRRLSDQLSHISLQLQLSLSALKLSEDELNQRIEKFRQSLPDVEREKLASEDMLSGDLKRIELKLGKEVEGVRQQAKEAILTKLESYFQTISDTETLERMVRDELSVQIPQFFSVQMRRVNELIHKDATDLLSLHQNRSNTLIEKVRQNAADLFSIPYRAPSAHDSYATFATPSWDRSLFISDMDPLGQKLSRKFLTYKFRHRRTISRLREEGRRLINQNVEQINWTLRRGLDESFRQFGADLAEQLDRTISATRAAMEVALQKSEEQGYATVSQEVKLKQVLDQVTQVSVQVDEAVST